MSVATRKVLIGLLLFLAAGATVGWLYDAVFAGLLIAALLALFWQVRQLLSFERALRADSLDTFRYGEGIWEQLFSRFRYERKRALRYKSDYRRLLKEIQKSTNAMPDGAVILDINNEIVSCNRAAKSLVGLKRRKDKGQRIDNILRAPKLNQLVHDSDQTVSAEIPSPLVDGDWLSCRVVPYGAEQKLLLIRDVTERRRLSKMRRDFVANASHELRSPLTVISGYLDALIEDEQVSSNWSKPLAQMRGQALRMQQILAELLELSRLEGGGPATTSESIDVGRLIESVSADYAGRPLSATIVVAIESPAHLLGVKQEIESVLVNLLSNAIRHTPADGEIVLSWCSGAEGAELIVRDTGEGIDEQHIPRLTERFFRVDSGRSRNEGGIGLGLAIVKHVLARHDAELIISSKRRSGSEFCCKFPMQRVDSASSAALS